MSYDLYKVREGKYDNGRETVYFVFDTSAVSLEIQTSLWKDGDILLTLNKRVAELTAAALNRDRKLHERDDIFKAWRDFNDKWKIQREIRKHEAWKNVYQRNWR